MHRYTQELKNIRSLLAKNPRGLTISEVSTHLNINRNSVSKYLDVLIMSGNVEMRSIGTAKVYFLAKRVPMSAMMNFSNDIFIITDDRSRIIDGNETFFDMVKKSKKELAGTMMSELEKFLIPDEIEMMRSALKSAVKGREERVDATIKTNTEERNFKLKFIPTTLNDGSHGVTIIAEDITEKRKTEGLLAESEQVFRAIFETAKDCIFIKDEKLRYTKINPAMRQLFDIGDSDIIGKTDKDLFGEKEGAHMMNIDRDVLKGKVVEEHPVKPVNGIPHMFHTIKVPLKDKDGKVIGICGIARDIR